MSEAAPRAQLPPTQGGDYAAARASRTPKASGRRHGERGLDFSVLAEGGAGSGWISSAECQTGSAPAASPAVKPPSGVGPERSARGSGQHVAAFCFTVGP